MKLFLPHNRKISGLFLCALVLALIVSAIHARLLYRDASSYSIQISMRSSISGRAQLFYNTGEGFSGDESFSSNVDGDFQFHNHDFALPCKTIYSFRFDPPGGFASIQRISIVNGFGKFLSSIDLDTLRSEHQIKAFNLKNKTLNIIVEEDANDPQIFIPLNTPLKLDTFLHLTVIPFTGRLLGGFILFFLTALFLTWMLRRRGIQIDFIDHPVEKSCNWIRNNKLFLGVILCIFAYRFFFVLTYPLDTCSDQWMYYQMMRNGGSTLIHATGYPFFMRFFSAFLPTKYDVLVFQHVLDFSVQLILMILLKKRFGLVAAITTGLFYGLELRTINWVSRSTPEWLQGVFFALSFVAAMEAYFAKRPVKKIFLYLLSAWAFAWTFLMKFLTVVMLPIYLILFVLEKREWKGRWFCFASMGIIIFAQLNVFIYLYHYPSTGTKSFTQIVGWTLQNKISSFLPGGRHLSESGSWSKLYCILVSEIPEVIPKRASKEISLHELFSHVDSVPQIIRKPYRERYRELLAKSDSELQTLINTKQNLKGLGKYFSAYFYLGLSETDSLLEKVFFETVASYPKEYFMDVIKGVKDSFFIKTSYYIATISNPHSDHPMQLNGNDIIRNLPWGYALYKAPPGYITCMYDEPIFLKSGLHFFSSWGEWVNLPVIMKWLFIFFGIVLAYMGYRKDKQFKPYIIYLSLGVLVLFLLIVLSNSIYLFRDKEFEACQHLLSVLLGISASSIVVFGELKS